jgi:hypothetical protein
MVSSLIPSNSLHTKTISFGEAARQQNYKLLTKPHLPDISNSVKHSPREADGYSATPRCPSILWNAHDPYRINNKPLEQSSLCPPLLVFENPFHITLPSMSGSSKWSPPFAFPHQNPVRMQIQYKLISKPRVGKQRKFCSTGSLVLTICLSTLYSLSPATQANRLQKKTASSLSID